MVAGLPAVKASTLVGPDDPITLAASPRRYVSRGGDKLCGALDRFGVAVSGRMALDAGASTGGFTDCLLSRGAAHVVAIDVGYGQLHWRLRQDPRVTVLERTNVRDLSREDLPYRADLVVADLSFISLVLALPALVRCSAEEAEFVLLAKPQFEVGRAEVGSGGVVSDPSAWSRVLRSVARACRVHGLAPLDVMASPLLGPAGNAEFLLRALSGPLAERRSPGPGGADDGGESLEVRFDRAVRDAIELRAGGG
jgi:23S rRNA (cytidine1920-2'-O)/16S rRNA (cytidine1409-2'-O)-methyltransferase